jgi:hypothetical protein
MDPTTDAPHPPAEETPGAEVSPEPASPPTEETTSTTSTPDQTARPVTPTTPARQPAPVRPTGVVAPVYDLQAHPITIVIQLQPADGDEQGRPVLISLRAGTQAPLFHPQLRYNELGPLPSAVTTLLQQLQLWALNEKQKAQRNRAGNATSTAPAKPAAPPAPAPAAGPPPAPAPADPDSKQLSMF